MLRASLEAKGSPVPGESGAGQALFRLEEDGAGGARALLTLGQAAPWARLVPGLKGLVQGQVSLEAHRHPPAGGGTGDGLWTGVCRVRDGVMDARSLPFRLVSAVLPGALGSAGPDHRVVHLSVPQGGADFMVQQGQVYLSQGWLAGALFYLTFEGQGTAGNLGLQGILQPGQGGGGESPPVHWSLTGHPDRAVVSFLDRRAVMPVAGPPAVPPAHAPAFAPGTGWLPAVPQAAPPPPAPSSGPTVFDAERAGPGEEGQPLPQ